MLFSMQFCLKRELLTTVRLVTGGISSLLGLNLDESEDFKVCVTEGLLLLMHRGYPEAKVNYSEEGAVSLEGVGSAVVSEPYPEEEISMALLEALVGNIQIKEEDGVLRSISFGFGAK